MANLPISALDVQTTLLDTDLLVVVDTTDHSMALTGTDKQITAANVIAGVKAALTTVPNTLVPFGNASSNLTTDVNFNYTSSRLSVPDVRVSNSVQIEASSGGGDFINIVAPPVMPSSYTITLPDQFGTSGDVFSTSGLGVVTYTPTDSAATVSTIMTRDVNGNSQLNVLGRGVTSTATAAGTTTLLPSSTANQIFTGVTTQTVRLPDVTAANMAIGFQWIITNQSTGVVTVQTNSGAALSPAVALSQNQSAYCTVVSLTNNLATSWVLDFIGTITGSAVSSLNTLTGALTMSQVVAVNDAGSSGGANSIQIGTSSSATGADAICIGRSSNSSAADTVSIGRSTMVGGGSVSSIAIGTNALNALTSTGTNNFGAGLGAGKLITNGVESVIIGANALDGSATASSSWVAIGFNAATGAVTTAADGGVAIGHSALNALTSGAHNTHVGYNGGSTVATTTGSNNTFVGYGITSAATVSDNTIVGNAATAGTVGGVCILGSSATASSTDSISIGRAASASTCAGCIAIGATAVAGAGTFAALAIGYGAAVSTNNSIAIGTSAAVNTGDGNIAIGASAQGTGAGGVVVIGVSATGTQAGAIAIGNSADSITGTNGIAIGTAAQSQIGNGIAIGNAATASTGTGNIAIGASSTASASAQATAIGTSSTASADGSTAVGNTAVATNANTAALGLQASASGVGAVALGAFATASSNGAIAIGAVTANVTDSLFFPTALASTTGTAVVFNASGQTGPLTSSLRFKKNVKNARDLTRAIDKIRVVEYDRKETNEHEIGLIAEEMMDIYPEIVPVDLEGKPYSVDYARLTVVLIQEIQKLRKRVSDLEEV